MQKGARANNTCTKVEGKRKKRRPEIGGRIVRQSKMEQKTKQENEEKCMESESNGSSSFRKFHP